MAQKPKKTTTLSPARKMVLRQEEWFVEYHNTDTRNAIAQGLGLVDSAGEEIFYDGNTHHGFQVSFDQVLFLVRNRPNGVFKFTAYHRPKGTKTWAIWREHQKTGGEHIKAILRKGIITKGAI